MKFSEMISNQSTTGFSRENVPIVRNPQADSDSVFGKSVEAIRGHTDLSCSAKVKLEGRGTRSALTRRELAPGIFEPSVAQPPLPLQEFLPLQPLSPVLQPPWPLQSFLPLQACLLLSAACKRLATLELPDRGLGSNWARFVR